MEYHKTKDLIHVQVVQGHRSIISKRMDTQRVNFKETDYHVGVASDVKEACELVKSGFQYVTGEYTELWKDFQKTETDPFREWWGRGDLNTGQVVTSPVYYAALPLFFKKIISFYLF